MPFEWIMGLLGGLLIGCAGALYLLVNGRIMGASGILGGMIDGSAHRHLRERGAFIAGLVIVPALIAALGGGSQTNLTGNWAVIIVAGLCVGVGTRLANGCTSGHGVCGISRLSWRGIAATIFYLAAGGLTVAFARHVWGII